jgi:hypothetical protein
MFLRGLLYAIELFENLSKEDIQRVCILSFHLKKSFC